MTTTTTRDSSTWLTADEIFAAADELFESTQTIPTVEAVHLHLGRGSRPTVMKHMQKWRSQKNSQENSALKAAIIATPAPGITDSVAVIDNYTIWNRTRMATLEGEVVFLKDTVEFYEIECERMANALFERKIEHTANEKELKERSDRIHQLETEVNSLRVSWEKAIHDNGKHDLTLQRISEVEREKDKLRERLDESLVRAGQLEVLTAMNKQLKEELDSAVKEKNGLLTLIHENVTVIGKDVSEIKEMGQNKVAQAEARQGELQVQLKDVLAQLAEARDDAVGAAIIQARAEDEALAAANLAADGEAKAAAKKNNKGGRPPKKTAINAESKAGRPKKIDKPAPAKPKGQEATL